MGPEAADRFFLAMNASSFAGYEARFFEKTGVLAPTRLTILQLQHVRQGNCIVGR